MSTKTSSKRPSKARVMPQLCYDASPSELVLADDCARAHDFRYRKKLRLRHEKRGGPLASGSAVATAVERYLWDYGATLDATQAPAILATLVEKALAEEFKGASDLDEFTASMRRFLPGVKRAVSRLPAWMWEGKWYVEHDVSGTFEAPDINIRVHGRLDMMRFIDTPVPTIELIDVKTTDHDPLEYVLWTPQLRIYAACLHQMYPERLVVYRYVCVPTGVSSVAKIGAEFVLTDAAYQEVTQEILQYGRKLSHNAEPRYARRCEWCSYKAICQAIITGADPAGITKALFEHKDGLDKPEQDVVNLENTG